MLYLHTRDTKLNSQTHSSCIDHMISYKSKLTRHALLAHTSYKYKLTRYALIAPTSYKIERKKACNCNYPLMILAITNDRTIKNFWRSNLDETLRVVFLFIDQLLLTIESKQLDISYMSTHPQEPIVSHRGLPTDVK